MYRHNKQQQLTVGPLEHCLCSSSSTCPTLAALLLPRMTNLFVFVTSRVPVFVVKLTTQSLCQALLT